MTIIYDNNIFIKTNVKSKSVTFLVPIKMLTIDLRPVTIFGFSPWSGISVTSTTCDMASPFSLRATNLYVPLSVVDICSISSFTVNSPYSKKSADQNSYNNFFLIIIKSCTLNNILILRAIYQLQSILFDNVLSYGNSRLWLARHATCAYYPL